MFPCGEVLMLVPAYVVFKQAVRHCVGCICLDKRKREMQRLVYCRQTTTKLNFHFLWHLMLISMGKFTGIFRINIFCFGQ